MGRPKKEIRKNETPVSINLLKEIIHILSETGKKAKLLNDCSKNDFSSQNKHLRQYFKEIKNISKNTNLIADLLTKSHSKNLSAEITDFQIYISSKSESLNKRYKNHVKLADEIKNKIIQIQVPIKNYKQNTLNLKKIVNNIKTNFAKQNTYKLEDPSISSTEEIINRMNILFPQIDDSLFKLQTLSDAVVKDLSEINKRNLHGFSELFYKLSLNNMDIISIVDEKTSQIPGLKEYAEQCYRSINIILKNLQYQDIINQKIDHVNSIHLKIITELKTADSSNPFNIDLKSFKLASRISEIAEIQAAQLIAINLEYKNAIENIRILFQDIAKYISLYSEANNDFAQKYKTIEKNIKNELQKRTKEFSERYEELLKFKKNYARDLKNIDKISDDIYSYFTSLNSLNANIEQLTFKILKKHFSSKEQKDVFSFAKQIEAVSTDSNKELHSIQYIYAVIQKNAKFLLLSIDNTRGDVLMLKREKEFADELNLHFSEIVKEFPLVNQLLQKNAQTCTTISKGILPTDNTQNYDSFYKTIEEIIFNLNHIYKQLRSENININQFRRDLAIPYKGKSNLTAEEKQLQNRTLNKLKGKNMINNNLYIMNSKKDNEIEIF